MPFRLFVLTFAVLCVGLVRAEDDPLAAAKNMFEVKEYDAARLLLEKHLETDPPPATAAEARFYLAESFMAQGKDAEAEKTFDLLLKTARKSEFAVPAEFRLAEMPYLQEKFAVAKPRLEAFVERHPHDHNLQFVLYYLGEISLRAESFDEAEHYFGLSVRMFPKGAKHLESQFGLAVTLARSEKKLESLKLFHQLSEDKRFLEMIKDGTIPDMPTLLKTLNLESSETPQASQLPETAEAKAEEKAEPEKPQAGKVTNVFASHLPTDEAVLEKLMERHPLPKDGDMERVIKGVSKELIGFEKISEPDSEVAHFYFRCKVRFVDVRERATGTLLDPERDQTDEFTISVTHGGEFRTTSRGLRPRNPETQSPAR